MKPHTLSIKDIQGQPFRNLVAGSYSKNDSKSLYMSIMVSADGTPVTTFEVSHLNQVIFTSTNLFKALESYNNLL